MMFMRRVKVLAAFAAGSMVLAAPAHAFTLSNTKGGDGFVTTSGTSFDLFGPDNGFTNAACLTGCSTLYTIKAAAAGNYSFSYTYKTADLTGLGVEDPAGYIFNGVRTQLSDDLAGTKSGSATITFKVGDVYGFYVDSVDGLFGRGDIRVTPSATPTVPEPASWAMMIAGFGMVGSMSRSRRMRLRAVA